MAEHFDAYHRWLGIPPKDQPPNYYRLLGLEKYEDDVEVIEAAAERATQYIGNCAQPSYEQIAAKLIQRIGRAKATLIDPAARAAYDDKLRATAAGVLSSGTGAAPPADAQPGQQPQSASPAVQPHAPAPLPAALARLPSGAHASPKGKAANVPPVTKTTLQHFKHAKPIAQAVPPSQPAHPTAKVQLVHPPATTPSPDVQHAAEPEAEDFILPDEAIFSTSSRHAKRKERGGRKSSKSSGSTTASGRDRKKHESGPNWLVLGGGAAVLLVLVGVSIFLYVRNKPDLANKNVATKNAAARSTNDGAQQTAESTNNADQTKSAAETLLSGGTDESDEDATSPDATGPGVAAAPPQVARGLNSAAPGETSALIALVVAGGGAAEAAELIKSGANLEAKDALGRTALRLAVKAERVDLVSALLAAEAKANSTDAAGETPLMSAAQAGNVEIVEALLAAGAEPSLKTTRGSADKPAGLTALLLAARHGKTAVVKILLAKGAPVDAANQDGVTPLMAAAAAAHRETVDTLLMEKANVSAVDRRGQTPLMFAAHGGSVEVVAMLLKHGAMANARTPEQVTALSIALEAKNAKVADALREAGKNESPILDF